MKSRSSNSNALDAMLQGEELAYLPPQDPRRAEIARLGSLSDAQRQSFLNLAEENDHLRAALNVLPLPDSVEQRLLAIPDMPHPPSRASRRFNDFLRQPVGWPHLAIICALTLLGLLAYFMWPKSAPSILQPLDKTLSRQIATLALAGHQSPPPFIGHVDDPQQLQAALVAKRLPFTVTIPQPQGTLKFVGGGITRLRSASAVFTRWQEGAATYTLYQFDPAPLDVPERFAPTADTSQHLKNGRVPCCVMIWPGNQGAGAWALVLENATMVNPFADACR